MLRGSYMNLIKNKKFELLFLSPNINEGNNFSWQKLVWESQSAEDSTTSAPKLILKLFLKRRKCKLRDGWHKKAQNYGRIEIGKCYLEAPVTSVHKLVLKTSQEERRRRIKDYWYKKVWSKPSHQLFFGADVSDPKKLIFNGLRQWKKSLHYCQFSFYQTRFMLFKWNYNSRNFTLIPDRISLIILTRSSLYFICFICNFWIFDIIPPFTIMRIIKTATPARTLGPEIGDNVTSCVS